MKQVKQIYVCAYRKGSTNLTGQKGLPDKCKERDCSGEFYKIPKDNKFSKCYVLNEDIISWEVVTKNRMIRTEIVDISDLKPEE